MLSLSSILGRFTVRLSTARLMAQGEPALQRPSAPPYWVSGKENREAVFVLRQKKKPMRNSKNQST